MRRGDEPAVTGATGSAGRSKANTLASSGPGAGAVASISFSIFDQMPSGASIPVKASIVATSRC